MKLIDYINSQQKVFIKTLPRLSDYLTFHKNQEALGVISAAYSPNDRMVPFTDREWNAALVSGTIPSFFSFSLTPAVRYTENRGGIPEKTKSIGTYTSHSKIKSSNKVIETIYPGGYEVNDLCTKKYGKSFRNRPFPTLKVDPSASVEVEHLQYLEDRQTLFAEMESYDFGEWDRERTYRQSDYEEVYQTLLRSKLPKTVERVYNDVFLIDVSLRDLLKQYIRLQQYVTTSLPKAHQNKIIDIDKLNKKDKYKNKTLFNNVINTLDKKRTQNHYQQIDYICNMLTTNTPGCPYFPKHPRVRTFLTLGGFIDHFS